MGLKLNSRAIPIIPEALEYAAMGLIPAGAYKNREFRECMTVFAPSVDRVTQDILFDPQTSGGLLICVPETSAKDLLRELKDEGIEDADIIGRVIPESKGRILVE